MRHIFTPEHFRTAEQYGMNFDGEKYPDGEMLAEVDVTLSALLRDEPRMSLSREDLEAYHWLQYGGLRGASSVAISLAVAGEQEEFIRSSAVKEKLEPLQRVLAYVLGPARLSMPLPLGRFPLSRYPMGSPQAHPPLANFIDMFEEAVPIEPIAARNPGPFLYPRQDIALSYNGTTKTDSEFGHVVFSELAERDPSLVERCMPNINRADLTYEDMPALHLDEITAEKDGSAHTFVAVSSDMMLFAVEPSPGFDFRARPAYAL